MQRGQLRDISSWLSRLLPEPFEGFNKPDALKMFSSKSSTTATSTFYTDLEVTTQNDETILQEFSKSQSSRDSQLSEIQSATSEDGNSQDSDSVVGVEEQQQRQEYSSHSFHRIASFGGFPRFQPFVMSASSPAECASESTSFEETTSSVVQMSHSVLEYRSSRCGIFEFIRSS